jgi:nickel-dependent lactate racemase
VHTYRKAGRHIVVLEDDKVIFNSILKPLTSEPLTEVVKKQRLDKPVVTANSDDEEELPAPIIVR